jgi:hypothetical protein
MSPDQEWVCVLHSPPFLSFKLYRSLGRLLVGKFCAFKLKFAKLLKNYPHGLLLLSSWLFYLVTVCAVLFVAAPALIEK